MAGEGDKLTLAKTLGNLVSEEQYDEVIKTWAASDEVLDYKQEVDYHVAHAVTQAYVALNDVDKAFFYAKFQIDYILNKNTELSDSLGFYMLVLINYYKQNKKLWELARVIMEKERRGLKLAEEIPELNEAIDNIAKQPKLQKVNLSIAVVIFLLFSYAIYRNMNDKPVPEWLTSFKDGLFFIYCTYVVITPLRRWLIKGWVRQFVKIY